MRVLLALGGNAMTAPDGSASPTDQMAAVAVATEHVVTLLKDGHEVVLTHGNGPQVGNLLVKNEMAAGAVPPVPLDWCGAQTQATIGYILMNELQSALEAVGLPQRPATVVTRMLVDAADPGFARPTKPIGRYLPAELAKEMVARGQTWEDRGERGWRRVVASPEPIEVLDGDTITTLVEAGLLVVSNGGGGIPVVRTEDGCIRGIEAVIDKDLGAVVLAQQIRADALVIATDVEHAVIAWGTPEARPIETVTVSRMRELVAEGHFASGSMGPKVDAACRFVEAGGRLAAITSMECIPDALDATAGTVVIPD